MLRRSSGIPAIAGPSRPTVQRYNVGDWDDDWVPPSDEDDDDDEDPDEPDEPDEQLEYGYEQEPARSPSAGERAGPPGSPRAAGVPSGGPAAAHAAAGAEDAAGRRDSQLTDRGYFDVKYYHNKLW